MDRMRYMAKILLCHLFGHQFEKAEVYSLGWQNLPTHTTGPLALGISSFVVSGPVPVQSSLLAMDCPTCA